MLPSLSKLTLDTEETSGDKKKRGIHNVAAGENGHVLAPQRRLNSVHEEHEYSVGIIPYGKNDPRTIDNKPGGPHGLLTRNDIARIVRNKEKMERFCNSEYMSKYLPEDMPLRNSKNRKENGGPTIVFAMEDNDLIGLIVIDDDFDMTFSSSNDSNVFNSPGVDDNGRLVYSDRKDYSYAWLQDNVDIDARYHEDEEEDAYMSNMLAREHQTKVLEILAEHKVVLPAPYLAYGCTVRSVEGDLCRTGVMRYLLAACGYWHNKVIVKNKVESMTRAAEFDNNAAKRKLDIAKASYLALGKEQDEIVAEREAMESAKTAYNSLEAIAEVAGVEGELSPAFVHVKAAKQTYDVANETYTRTQSVLERVTGVYERAKADFASASATLDSLSDKEALARALRRLSFLRLTALDDNALKAWSALGFNFFKVFKGQYTSLSLVRNIFDKHVDDGVPRPVASDFIGRCRKAGTS